MIRSMIKETLFLLYSSRTLLLALLILADLLQILGHQINHILCLLAGFLSIPLLFFSLARFLLEALQVYLFDRRL